MITGLADREIADQLIPADQGHDQQVQRMPVFPSFFCLIAVHLEVAGADVKVRNEIGIGDAEAIPHQRHDLGECHRLELEVRPVVIQSGLSAPNEDLLLTIRERHQDLVELQRLADTLGDAG